MNFILSEQVDADNISSLDWDLAIVASGFERRGSHLVRKLGISAGKKLAFAFSNRRCHSRDFNDRVFANSGFRLIEEDGDHGERIQDELMQFVKRFKGSDLRILVDYSCMTREWYASIINFFRRLESFNSCVEIFFSYSHAVFRSPSSGSPNSHVGAIDGFSTITLPRLPTALVIGLGNEPNRCLGIKEYIDPAETFLFYTDPCVDPQFRRSIKSANRLLFELTPQDRVYTYPADGIQRASALLTSLTAGLREKYRLILAPLGPKPFSLLCLLVAMRLRDVEVWRITSGQLSDPVDQAAIGQITVLRVVFVP
ncbi:MAG: hypothetical protein JNJ70_16455 [Verrucomicrobiales bacterium]|nr:hypothetical protein [Verrucomicrobiales bacterium]